MTSESETNPEQPNSANPPTARPDNTGYQIGYGKPPKTTRFQPGKSGNPKGRPRGSKSINALLDKALSSPVSITEGGKVTTIEQRAVLFKALVAKAIKGDPRSAALVIRLMEQAGMHKEPIQPITRIERVIVRPASRDNDDTGAGK